jgi:polysaccharide biosynthesis protein PslJ
MDVSLAPAAPRAARRFLPQGWPLHVLILGYPLWWVAGLSNFGWLFCAVPMAVYLLIKGHLRISRGFGIWVCFLLWMFASSIELEHATSFLTFGFRAACYCSATVWFLYIVNLPGGASTTRKIVFLLCAFWLIIVAGGYAGLKFPHLTLSSAMELVLPSGLASLDFVHLQIHPQLAEIQTFIGYTIARPSAPFPYTNWWGGNLGALTPFVLVAVVLVRSTWRKAVIWILLAVALVPIVLSVNRGLWISLSVGLLYALFRFLLWGNVRLVAAILVAVLVAAAGVFLSPLKTTIQDRIEHPGSTNVRYSVAQAAVVGVKKSPLFGYGVPVKPPRHYGIPNVGTGGLYWLIMFTTGIPGVIFFAGWFLQGLWATRKASTPVMFWAHVSILIVLIQMFVYDMLPVELHVLMIAVALAYRESARSAAEQMSERRDGPYAAVQRQPEVALPVATSS